MRELVAVPLPLGVADLHLQLVAVSTPSGSPRRAAVVRPRVVAARRRECERSVTRRRQVRRAGLVGAGALPSPCGAAGACASCSSATVADGATRGTSALTACRTRRSPRRLARGSPAPRSASHDGKSPSARPRSAASIGGAHDRRAAAGALERTSTVWGIRLRCTPIAAYFSARRRTSFSGEPCGARRGGGAAPRGAPRRRRRGRRARRPAAPG